VSIEIGNLFPIPVGMDKYPNANDIKQTLVPKFKEQEKLVECNTYYPGGYTSYGSDESILQWNECSDLVKFITNSVTDVHAGCGLSGDVNLQNSWFSINRKHALHENHMHLPSTWSGVYYVQCDGDAPGLTFINKHLESGWPYCQADTLGDYSSNSCTVQPSTGSIIIFPSYFTHKVEQQRTDNERISIAFNFGVSL
jgi:uncharacterized protein (TIGR02466 family)